MSEKGKFEIKWIDGGRETQCAPDPKYPLGIDVDAAGPMSPSCSTPLPYPAMRCGLWRVRCLTCGYSVAITTAGRSDDPRSIKMPCRFGVN